MKALIIIDLQYDFLPGGALAVGGGDEIIDEINVLQDQFDLVVATQDWHPAGHLSFASSHPGKTVFEEIDLNGLSQVLWPDHCVQNSKGAELTERLDQKKIEAVFRKGTMPDLDSYSCFFDNGHRKSTGLSAYLKGRGITEVYITGLAADFCVWYSAKDAIEEGFTVYIIENATRAIDPLNFHHIKQQFMLMGGIVI